jgi:hypothetical protein
VTSACLLVYVRATLEDLELAAAVTIRGSDESDRAVQMIVVIPVNKHRYPVPPLFDRLEGARGKRRTVLHGSEE